MLWTLRETSFWRAPPKTFQTISLLPWYSRPLTEYLKFLNYIFLKSTIEVDIWMTSSLGYHFSLLSYQKYEQGQVGKS